jgi:hypothetical protein
MTRFKILVQTFILIISAFIKNHAPNNCFLTFCCFIFKIELFYNYIIAFFMDNYILA